MKAIKVIDQGKADIREVPLPKLRDDYVLVKVKAVALNPTDWKHIERIAATGCTVGCDYYGIVEEIGPKVTKPWNKGYRIAGFTHGVNLVEKEDGCFAEYCVAKGDVQLRVPDNISDEEAATLGLGVVTVGQGLYQSLGLPLPGSGKAKMPLLVYGGSTATGSLAIQYGVLSGCYVVTTCSPRNFSFVKALGAAEVFDYEAPECGRKIRESTKDQITIAFDCIADKDSSKICCDAISSQGGQITSLLRTEHRREDVANKFTLAYTYTGETFNFFGRDVPSKPDDFEFAKVFLDLSAELLRNGEITVHPPQLGRNGLKGVFHGLKQLQEGKVSGRKLVYRVADTP